jgi:hypothetical protein
MALRSGEVEKDDRSDDEDDDSEVDAKTSKLKSK